jgi:hypothetical protein
MNKPIPLSSVLRAAAFAVIALGAVICTVPAEAQTRPALVRDVDNGALQPFRDRISISAAAGETSKTVNGPVIPAGKRLVIENVSVWATTPLDVEITGVWLEVAGVSTFAMMDPNSTERRDIGGAAVSAYNRPVKLYYNPGETIQAQVFFKGTSGAKVVNIYLNGYYVNL